MHSLSADFISSYSVAFLMGLFSSLHCLGMCGSIIGSLTLSLDKSIRLHKHRLWPYVLSYNLGRIVSYAIAGLLAGFAEEVLSRPLGGQGHRVLQVLSALIMMGAGLYIAGWFPRFAYIEKIGSHFWRQIEPYGRKLIPIANLPKAFFFGMIWGWLPCGLVYTALALSATTGDMVRSSLTMLAFGSGTIPAVLTVGVMTSWMVKLAHMKRFRQVTGLTFILLSILAAFPWLNPMAKHLA
mgnify:FL=1